MSTHKFVLFTLVYLISLLGGLFLLNLALYG